jgi:hypothetical protein
MSTEPTRAEVADLGDVQEGLMTEQTSHSVSEMPGRRVPDGTSVSDYKPGDYGKRGSRWWVCLPTGITGHLDERWTCIEHEDGTATLGDPLGGGYRGPTITVTPSIWDSPQGWHGWLDHGYWRSV